MISTDNTICRARDGMQNCPYHRHVLAMYKAAERGMEGLEVYYQERKIVEQMLLDGWVEEAVKTAAPADPFDQVDRVRAAIATPVRHQPPATRRVQVDQAEPRGTVAVATRPATGGVAIPRQPERQTVAASSKPTTDGNSVEVSINHKPVRFYRARQGVSVAEPQYIRIQSTAPISDADLRLMDRHLRFAYKQNINSRSGAENRVGRLFRDGQYAFVVPADMSLTNRPNLAKAAAEFQRAFVRNISQGTPANRDGERTLEGLGERTPSVAVFYDSVTIDA